jgi:hypothetical protein
VSLPHSGFLLGVPGALGYLAGVLAVFATKTAVRWPSGAQESTRATACSFPPSLEMAGPAAATSSCKHQGSRKKHLLSAGITYASLQAIRPSGAKDCTA